MKPAWDQLMEEYKGRDSILVADVDCTAEGKALCETHEIRGFPTIKYGSPAELKDYSGGRDFEALKAFAEENLGPQCGPANVDLCDDETKATYVKYLALSKGDLETALTKAQTEAKAAVDALRREWTVHIDREEGTLLGAAIQPVDDNFKINEIKDGAVKTFNEANPDAAVLAGDKITKVNTATGTDAMQPEFKQKSLDLVVLREATAEQKAAAVKASGLRLIKSALAHKAKQQDEL